MRERDGDEGQDREESVGETSKRALGEHARAREAAGGGQSSVALVGVASRPGF